MNDNMLPKIVVFGLPPGNRRKTGRSQVGCLKVKRNDLEETVTPSKRKKRGPLGRLG